MDSRPKKITTLRKETHQDGHRLISTLVEVLKASWVRALAALISALGLIFLFGLLADQVFDKELVNIDNNLALWTYSLSSPALTFFFTIITDIGSPVGIGVLTALTFGLLIWRRMYGYGWIGVVLVGGGALLDEILKLIFKRVRPELLLGGQHLTSYSFPSGHATGAICFFGFLIWLSWKLLAKPVLKVLLTFIGVIMILLVGFSRIYLGVHYPSDVLGGYLAGGSWLIILLSGYNIFYRFRKNRPAKSKEEHLN